MPNYLVDFFRGFSHYYKLIFKEQMPLEEFDNYDVYWIRRETAHVMYRHRFIANLLPDEGSLLDIGCGSGVFLEYLRSRKPKLTLKGIDISEVAIMALTEKGIDGEIFDFNKQDFPPSTHFDYVTIMELLEHLYNPEDLMHKLKDIGAKRYFVTIPNLGFIINRLRLAFGGKMPLTVIIFHIREHIRFWTVQDFKYWSEKMGYRVLEYHGQNGISFLWKFWPSLFAKQMIYILALSGRDSDSVC